MDIIILGLIILFIFLLAAVFVAFSLEHNDRKRFWNSLEMSLFLVMMPKMDAGKEGNNPKAEKELIAQMEQIFSNFLYVKSREMKESPSLTFEIASQIGETDISFYVSVPRFLETSLEKYIHGVYPNSLVEKVPHDYTVFEPGGVTAGCYMKLGADSLFPINTYQNLEKDPIAAITSTLNKITANEGAAFQVVIRSIDQNKWRKTGEKVLDKMQDGKSAHKAIKEANAGFWGHLSKELSGAMAMKSPEDAKQDKADSKHKKGVTDQVGLENIQKKIQKQAFETNIRLVASAGSNSRAEEILRQMEGAFGQFSLSSVNSLEPVYVRGKAFRKFIYDFSFRNFDKKQSNVLNIEELTSIYHFPTHYVETPYIKSIKSKVSAPPMDLPTTGVVSIGSINFQGDKKNVMFANDADRRRHFYVIGQTGTGKSTLLREMIRQDILNGKGVAVIDPHGDLVEQTLANIPKERAEDVVLFEPFDMERPMGLNMLEYDTPEQKDFAVQEMIAIFYKLFPPEIIGPMFEHYMRNAMLLGMADKDNPGTLVEIPRMFTDDKFMEEKLSKVTDHVVREFWEKEWKKTTGSTRSDMLGYVVSKIGRFIENEMMRNIIGQSHSSFDLSKIMDEKKIFLANLSKGLTGEVNSSLLGLILVSKMQMAAMRRARIPEDQRQDFYLYIDEFQNFTTDSIATILSEARKYKLNLFLAHQYMPQLKDEIKNAVLGNVGTLATYRIGAEDAEFLQKQFQPEFSAYDLVNLDNYNFVVKMMINGRISTPFKVVAPGPQKGNPAMVEPIRKLSKLKFGLPRAEVEQDILFRTNIGVPPAPIAPPMPPPLPPIKK